MDINAASALLWGFAAVIVLTVTIIGGESFGLTRIDIPFIVGTMFTANRDRAKVIGYLVHGLFGWLFAMVYALFFESVGVATWSLGLVFGIVQGAFVCVVVLPLLPGIHPRMVSDSRGPQPTRLLEPPGFLATNYGRNTPIVLIIAHGLFGLVLGTFYTV